MSVPLSRRSLVRAASISALGLALALPGCSNPPRPPGNSSTGAPSQVSTEPRSTVLLAYFSRAGENYWNGGRTMLDRGNTEVLASMIESRIGCDVYRIEAADAYPVSYEKTVARNVAEEQSDARPAIANPLPCAARPSPRQAASSTPGSAPPA